jgi:hypothetical protein
MLIARLAGASAAIALSCFNAFGESPQIVAVSGRDQLALHDLATGEELARSMTMTSFPAVYVVPKLVGYPPPRSGASVLFTCI